jgi:Ca2+-binding EF-hand superfamily protein
LFRKVDLDNNGIIDEDEFIKLVNYMNCYKTNMRDSVKRSLNHLDPNNNRTFTYSDLVNFFSKEVIEVTDYSGKSTELNILDKISME